MHSPNPKVTMIEIVMIELMRLNPRSEEYHEVVDNSIAFEVREFYISSPEKFRSRLIAERARLFCQNGSPNIVHKIQSYRLGFVGLSLVLAIILAIIFAKLTALTVPAKFFSSSQGDVSVMSVMVLICLMSLPCLVPIISLVSLIIQRVTGREVAVIVDIFLCIPKLLIEFVKNFRGRRSFVSKCDSWSRGLSSVFHRNSYFASAFSIFLFNLYYLLSSIVICFILWQTLFSRNVNYFHESSLISPAQSAIYIHSAGVPVYWITGTLVPSKGAMEWALGSLSKDTVSADWIEKRDLLKQITSEKKSSINSGNVAEFRREWSVFMLSSVLVWVFLPRVFVACLASLCMLFFKRDFLPKGTDSYIKCLESHIFRNTYSLSLEINDQMNGSITSHEPGEIFPMTLPESKNNLNTTFPTSIASETSKDQILIAGFNLGSNGKHHLERLSQSDKRFYNLGDLNGAEQQLSFSKVWDDVKYSNNSLVVMVSLASVPTASFVEFLSKVVSSATRRPADRGTLGKVQIVMIDGLRTREQLNYDSDAFDYRVDQWTKRCLQSKIDNRHIYKFDQSTSTAINVTRKHLLEYSDCYLNNQVILAGKSGMSINIVLREFNSAFAESSKNDQYDWTKLFCTVSEELGTFYMDDSATVSIINESNTTFKVIQNEIASLNLHERLKLPEELQSLQNKLSLSELQDLMNLVKTLSTSVSARWMISGALCGVGLAAVGGVAMISTFGLPAVPALLPLIGSSGISGATIGQLLKTVTSFQLNKESNDTSTIVASIDIEAQQVLQALILLIICLELQGNPENVISDHLKYQSEQLGSPEIIDLNDVEALLNDFAMNLNSIGDKTNGC